MRGVQICTPYRVHRYVSSGDFVTLYHLRHGNRPLLWHRWIFVGGLCPHEEAKQGAGKAEILKKQCPVRGGCDTFGGNLGFHEFVSSRYRGQQKPYCIAGFPDGYFRQAVSGYYD